MQTMTGTKVPTIVVLRERSDRRISEVMSKDEILRFAQNDIPSKVRF
jgi:hypothetical protein